MHELAKYLPPLLKKGNMYDQVIGEFAIAILLNIISASQLRMVFLNPFRTIGRKNIRILFT